MVEVKSIFIGNKKNSSWIFRRDPEWVITWPLNLKSLLQVSGAEELLNCLMGTYHVCFYEMTNWNSGPLTQFFLMQGLEETEILGGKKLVILHYNFLRTQKISSEFSSELSKGWFHHPLGGGGLHSVLPEEVYSWSKVLVHCYLNFHQYG